MPTRQFLRQDTYLPGFSLAKMNSQDMYIYDKALPAVPVPYETGKFAIWGDAAFLKFAEASANFGMKRAPGAHYGRYNFDLTTAGSFTCEEIGHEFAIDDRTKKDAKDPIDLEEAASIVNTEYIFIEREKLASTLLFTGGNYTNTAAVGTGWDDNTSDMWGDANTAHQTTQKAVGRRCNTVIMGQEVFDAIMIHPQATDQIKYNTNTLGGLPQDALAKFFRVNQVLVGGAINNTAKEGQSNSNGYIWGKSVAFLYLEPGVNRYGMSFAKSFQSQPFEVTVYREEQSKSDIVRGSVIQDEKICAADAGYLFTSVVS